MLAPADDAPRLPPDLSRRIEHSFARGSGYGLLQLGAAEVDTPSRSLSRTGESLPPRIGCGVDHDDAVVPNHESGVRHRSRFRVGVRHRRPHTGADLLQEERLLAGRLRSADPEEREHE
jgi:hypothetical protein